MSNQNKTIKTEDNWNRLLTGKPGELVEHLEECQHPPLEKVSVKVEEELIEWSEQHQVGTSETRPESHSVIDTYQDQDQDYKDYLNNLVLSGAIQF